MSHLTLHPSVQFAWAIANIEANRGGSPRIEPAHFLLACLRIADDAATQEAELVGLNSQLCEATMALAGPARRLIGLSENEITAARRGLARALHRDGTLVQVEMLHRSEAARDFFLAAARRTVEQNASELTLLHLLSALLDNLPAQTAGFFTNRQPVVDPPSPPTPPAAGQNRRSQTPTLEGLGRDVTALARAGRLAPVVGRKPEMTAIARYLQRTTKRNVLIIGDAGVGKTAIVEGLAQRTVAPDAPEFLRTLRIIQVNVADLVAGTKYRGDMEDRLQRILQEAISDPNVVLFLDEIHLVMGSGTGTGAPMDIANILKPALARDDFRCIGATTTDEYERHLKSDAAFLRRFQIVRVTEPTPEDALPICQEWARRIEKLQHVTIEEAAVQAAVTLSAQLIRGRALPDKAIDLLENAAVFAKVSSLSFRPDARGKTPLRVTREQIVAVLQEQYGITVTAANVLNADAARRSLEVELIGQTEAVQAIADTLNALGTRPASQRRALGVLLFTGPTGVGKTFAAECLSRALFGDGDDALGRFNMSEYKERHELARLIGAPPGFIGHEHTGSLFRFVEAQPQGLILLDEMEKAHPEIQDFFLQVFDKGEARDSRGRVVDFRRHLFVLTCNLDSQSTIGFQSRHEGSRPGVLLDPHLRECFRPEFLGRIDQVVNFRGLDLADYQELADRQLSLWQKRLERTVEMTDVARKAFYAKSLAQAEGARGFLKLWDQLIVAPLTQYVETKKGSGIIRVDWDDQGMRFS